MASVNFTNARLEREEYDETKPPGERFVVTETIPVTASWFASYLVALMEVGEYLECSSFLDDFLGDRYNKKDYPGDTWDDFIGEWDIVYDYVYLYF